MANNNICRLDYLVGSLATAYKGVITSLVVKDFCITEEDNVVTLRGSVLAMPDGDYEASLIENGIELARSTLHQGKFEFKIDNERAYCAQNLQTDIIQNGKHIGTFLLKCEHTGGPYISAVELSDDLKGIDFKRLSGSLHDRVGLLQRAEMLITQFHSTKKDWPAISDNIVTFSIDVFWSARSVFHNSFSILIHFLRLAVEKINDIRRYKSLANLLELIELPLAHEADNNKLYSLASLWIREIDDASIDFSPYLSRFGAILSGIAKKFVDIEVAPIIRSHIRFLKEKIERSPVLSGTIADILGDCLQRSDIDIFNRYTEEGRQALSYIIENAEDFIDKNDPKRAINILTHIDMSVLDDVVLVNAFFDINEKYLNDKFVDIPIKAINEFLKFSSSFSDRALERICQRVPLVIKKLIALGNNDECYSVLEHLQRVSSPFKEKIIMNSEIAKVVFEYGSEKTIQYYCYLLTRIMIPSAKVAGYSADSWAEIVSPLHMERISEFMDVLQLDGDRLKDVLIHVIANLYISNVIIPDDILFQRKISSYLNADSMRTNVLLNYILLKRFPIYFNEIGATNLIRDHSTKIDSWGNDPVLYFLRKQVHVNASNNNIRLIEEIIRSWVFNDASRLKGVIPGEVFRGIKQELIEEYSAAINLFFNKLGIIDNNEFYLERILTIPESMLETVPQTCRDEIGSKILLLCRLYREIVKKYTFLTAYVRKEDMQASLLAAVEQVKTLNGTILSPQKTEALESLYFKRHIAFGIPSVLGTYHETKFDAFGELLRFEYQINIILEEIIDEVASGATAFSDKALTRWIAPLKAAYNIMSLHGLKNLQIEDIIIILDKRTLYLSQVADLLKLWQKELMWIVSVLNRMFFKPLADILKLLPHSDLPTSILQLAVREGDLELKAVDLIIRNIINDMPGLIESDRLIDQLLRVIKERNNQGFDDVLNAAALRADVDYFLLNELSDLDSTLLAPVIGSKAKNLVYLSNKGFHVPYGIVFSAGHTNLFQEYTDDPNFMLLLKQAVSHLEDLTEAHFGGNAKPLFLSVRSGSYISMPGILSSVLFCGMNGQTVKALEHETGNSFFAMDAYRRFLEHYASIIFGLDLSTAAGMRTSPMNYNGNMDHDEHSLRMLQRTIDMYLNEFAQKSLVIPDDVYEQLRLSIRAVYASWYSHRAVSFRRAFETSERWGTAVTLMPMVYGNQAGSGSSVFFTRNPMTYEPGIYGDTREEATGEDIVYGKQNSRPLAKMQTRNNQRSLEEADPDLFALHGNLATMIESAMGGLPQEVEVTYTRNRYGKRTLYVLQSRRMNFGGNSGRIFSEICKMESSIIGRGVGAHGGALSGVASFASSVKAVLQLRKTISMPIILIRKMANTDDVSLMPYIHGIVTSSGGATSHAAVLAQIFDVNAVLACPDLAIVVDKKGEAHARIGDALIKEGSLLSIDGGTGLIYAGGCLAETSNSSIQRKRSDG